MTEDWKNRLAFIDGIMPTQEDAVESTVAKRTTRSRKPTKSKSVSAITNQLRDIEKEIIAELIDQNRVFMAARYYQRARKRMENPNPDTETVALVANLLASAINYFLESGRSKDVASCNIYLTNWYWIHGNQRQKEQAIAYARRNIKQVKRNTKLTDAQIIEQFNTEIKGRLA